MRNRYQIFAELWRPFLGHQISLHASGSAYYLLLSFFPASVLFLSIIPYLSVSETTWSTILTSVLPERILDALHIMWKELYTNRNVFTISISTIITIWSASKGLLALMDGLNAAFGIIKKHNFVIRRILAFCNLILIFIILVPILILILFGNLLLQILSSLFPGIVNMITYLLSLRIPVSVLVLTLFFTILYRYLPLKKLPLRHCLNSGVIVALLWILFTKLFSMYILVSVKQHALYGSLSILLFAAIWLRSCISIFLYGGVLTSLKAQGNYFPHRIICKTFQRYK